jgi:ferredoxin
MTSPAQPQTVQRPETLPERKEWLLQKLRGGLSASWQPILLAEKCKGCGSCARNCPALAISGVPKQPYFLNVDACVRCGACLTSCRLGAIGRLTGQATLLPA